MLIVERGAAQNTIESYRRDLFDFHGFCAARKRSVENADSTLIRSYVKKLSSAGMAPSYMQKEYGTTTLLVLLTAQG